MPFQNANLDGRTGSDELMIQFARVIDQSGTIRLGTDWYWNLKGTKVKQVTPPSSWDSWPAFPFAMDLDGDGRDEIVTWSQSLIVVGKAEGTTTPPAPVAVADSATTTAGTAVTIDVLANDSGTGLTIGERRPRRPTARRRSTPTGPFTYTPEAGYQRQRRVPLHDPGWQRADGQRDGDGDGGRVDGAGVSRVFRDQYDPLNSHARDLELFGISNPAMTNALCEATCASRGFAYAGTQLRSWCFCDNHYEDLRSITQLYHTMCRRSESVLRRRAGQQCVRATPVNLPQPPSPDPPTPLTSIEWQCDPDESLRTLLP